MPSDFLKPGRDGLAFMCSGSLFQDLIVLGKNENLWLSTVEWGIGKLSFVFVLFLVFGGETSQTKSSSGSSIDLDCALWRRWSYLILVVGIPHCTHIRALDEKTSRSEITT